MAYQLTTAKIWNGSAWVNAQGGTGTVSTSGLLYSRTRVSGILTVTSGATIHTYGAWVQLDAGLQANTSALKIYINSVSGSNADTSSILSIGTGASGAEVELFAYGAGGASLANGTGILLEVPCKLSAGTRIAARYQSIIANKQGLVGLWTMDSDANTYSLMPTQFDSIGNNLSTSNGTTLSSSNTWTQIISSTTNSYRGLSVIIHGRGNSFTANANATWDVGLGASGSETIVGTGRFTSTTSEQISHSFNSYIPVSVPIGTRIAVRQSTPMNNIISATVIGVRT